MFLLSCRPRSQGNNMARHDTQHSKTVPLCQVSRYIYCYAECHFADYHYAECHYGECHYAEYHYAECHYAECHYAECRGANYIHRRCRIYTRQWFKRRQCQWSFGWVNYQKAF